MTLKAIRRRTLIFYLLLAINLFLIVMFYITSQRAIISPSAQQTSIEIYRQSAFTAVGILTALVGIGVTIQYLKGEHYQPRFLSPWLILIGLVVAALYGLDTFSLLLYEACIFRSRCL